VRPLAAAAAQTARCILIVRVGQTNKQQTPSFEFYLLANTYPLLYFQEKCLLILINVFRRKISFRKIA
jgi:hypothetical protein